MEDSIVTSTSIAYGVLKDSNRANDSLIDIDNNISVVGDIRASDKNNSVLIIVEALEDIAKGFNGIIAIAR